MKQNYKKVIPSFLLLGMVLSPVFAYAETPTPTPDDSKGNICARLPEFRSKIEQRITNHGLKIGANIDETRVKAKTLSDKHQTNLQEFRDQSEQRFIEMVNKFGEKADTEAKKQAILAFQKATQSAREARQSAVDAANKSFQNSLAAIVESRGVSVKNALQAFGTSLDTAISKATTDCANKVSAKTVRTNLTSSIESARKTLQASRTKIGDTGFGHKTASKVRKAAIEKAVATYKSAIEKAKKDLLVVFPKVQGN